MRIVGWVLVVLSIVLFTVYGFGALSVHNRVMNSSLSYWNLADKSSTLEAKCDNIDKFVAAINKETFTTNNAWLYPNINNSIEYNKAALLTLQKRLHEIKRLDPNSLAYATSIQQITAQEQGEAQYMIGEIYGCLYKATYSMYWGWLSVLILTLYSIIFIVGCVFCNWD
jgi:hypothetical protein